jgi:hypothetical protein
VRTFRFRHTWRVPADVGTTFAALADVDRYPQWWPQVRRVVRVDGSSGHAFVRSVLPYTLDLVLTREVEDPESRLLRVRISGDLEGWSAFALTASAGSTLALYEQECCMTPSGMGRIVPVAAPVLRLNHTWMMRSGERGLARWLTP